MALYETLGLGLINLLARGGRYTLSSHSYGDHERQRMDVYRHAETVPGRPAVVFYYGGNWQSGRRQDYRFVADTLVRLGYDVFLPDYRLYPDVRFDQIMADAAAALQRVRDSHDGPLVVMGHSAGAQIGALLSLRKGAPVNGFVGLAGPYDFFPFTEVIHEDLFAPPEQFPDSQPVNFVNKDAPPLYLLHGREDQRVRRGHSKSLMEKQQAVGGQADREVYQNLGHVDIILSFTAWHRRENPVVRDIDTFIRRVTHGE